MARGGRFLLVLPLLLVLAGCGARRTSAEFIKRGDEQVAAGHLSAAAIEYRNAIKREPSLAEAHRKLADAYAADDKLEQAYHAYANAIELDQQDVHSRVEAGRLLFGAGRFNEALVRAEQALERDERNVDAQ